MNSSDRERSKAMGVVILGGKEGGREGGKEGRREGKKGKGREIKGVFFGNFWES